MEKRIMEDKNLSLTTRIMIGGLPVELLPGHPKGILSSSKLVP
jgi:hypothetical protein